MEKFTVHTGVGVPLRRSNVDTDQIIPAVYLKRVTRTGFEDALFAAWRGDPSFVLNQDAYRAGTVLVAGICAQEDIELLWKILENNPGTEVTVSLEDRTATAGDVTVQFVIDDYTRWRLMEGLDDIGLTLQNEADITEYETHRASWRPKTLPAKHEAPVHIEAARPTPGSAEAEEEANANA